MVTIILHCPRCQSEALVRNGHAPNGKQLYRCRACGRQSRENPTSNAYQERSSLRGLTRTFGVSRTTVSKWIKKSSSTSSFAFDQDGYRKYLVTSVYDKYSLHASPRFPWASVYSRPPRTQSTRGRGRPHCLPAPAS